MRALWFLMFVASLAQGAGARLVSSFHLDLDDCDDVAVDSRHLYFACHSAHAPGETAASPPNMDGWVAKMDRRTGRLVYLTRLGGQGVDMALRVRLDRKGDAFVVGFTGSRDFPTTPDALQPNYGGGDTDAFLTEIGPNGKILYSTFLGGSLADEADALALLPDGRIVMAGRTWSGDFPGVAAETKFGPGGKSDAFVTRLTPGNSTGLVSAILGGKGDEKLTGVALAGADVFITGYTESRDFPTAQPFQRELKGTIDAFVARLPDGFRGLTFSTYFGGSGGDSGWGITLDPQGNPVVAGITTSDDLPATSNAPQPRRMAQADAFVVKLDPSGQRLLFSTYYGGSGVDHAGYDGANVVVGESGVIWMVGLTDSRDLKMPGAIHPRYGGGEQEGFLIGFSAQGKLCFGTYTNGTARYLLEGIRLVDGGKTVYAVGTVIRPVNKDSPIPDPRERYGMFVIGVQPGNVCR